MSVQPAADVRLVRGVVRRLLGSAPFGPANLPGRLLLLASRPIGRNALFAVAQSVLTGFCFFLIYRVLVDNVGIERAGVFSLMTACAGLLKIADISGSTALARFVAISARDMNGHSPRDYVHTVALSALATNMALGLLAFAAAPYLLPRMIDARYLAEARDLLPFIVGLVVMGPLAALTLSGIDGVHRTDERAIIGLTSALFSLAAAWLLVPRFGVVGFGASQLVQHMVCVTLGWCALRAHIGGLGWFPRRWRRGAFLEAAAYMVKFNAASGAGLFFDPLAKFGVNAVGGVGLVAYYDLASRLVTQMRALTVAAFAPLVPVFVSIGAPGTPAFGAMLAKSTGVASLAAVAAALLCLFAAPVVSLLVLSRLDAVFLAMGAVLTIGWCSQIVCFGFYFAAQASGVMAWNFLMSVVMSAAAAVGAFFIGPAYGLQGLLVAVACGLALAAVPVLLGNACSFGSLALLRRLAPMVLGAVFVTTGLGGAALALIGWVRP